MRIAIVGIGGVGGYYGGKLAGEYASGNEHDVFFVARGKHLEAIQKSGLEVTTKDEGSFVARPTVATDNPEELGLLDLIIFCVKGYNLEDAAQMMTGTLHPDTVIITVLNGVDNVERLRTVLPQGNILNGCVYISSRVTAPGKIEQVGGPRTLLFGPEEGSAEPFRSIETLMTKAAINAVLSNAIAVDVWSKYIFVGPLGGITSMVNKPLGAIMEDDEYRTMLEKMMREVESIAKKKHIPLPDTIVQQSLDITLNFPYETKTSIQLDFEKGTRTELETFTGYVVKAGKELGIDTPLHNEVYSTLKRREEG